MGSRASEKIVDALVERLTALRKDKGLSHEAIAKKAGLNRSTISLIESRKREPTLLTCLKIADALGISLGEALIKSEKKP